MESRRGGRGVGVCTAAMALCTLSLGAMAPNKARADAEVDPLPTYAFAENAQPIEGGATSADGPQLKRGTTYRDSLGPGQELFYWVDLDDASSAYVFATAVPDPASTVSHGDGIDAVLMDRAGKECHRAQTTKFGFRQAHPVADVAVRRFQEDGECQRAGTYYVKIRRVETTGEEAHDRAPWPIELRYLREPAPSGAVVGSPPPSAAWPSASPAPPSDRPQPRTGGTGFNDARAVDTGVWTDRLLPGQTRFYRIPLDWGRQVSIDAELAKSTMTKDYGYAPYGLAVELYNPARIPVVRKHTRYDGEQALAAFGPTAPADYQNRFAFEDPVRAMCLSGWYYLAVTLDREVGDFTSGSVPLTLRTRLSGERTSGPGYREDATSAGFGLSARDRSAAREGLTPEQAADSSSMKVLATSSFSVGTLLLLGLGAWTWAARRARLRSG
ncbi:hypothetical protein [Streptomyces sp. NPDC006879]|uniref:hypothetical protein n=1 Tax=Streptomyces sp. NPDC006879 TaxID=3364767 RepID=UPI0036A53491